MNENNKINIAVVEDEADLGSVCVEILQCQGYKATHFPDADSFLKAWPLAIDLLIADINLGGKSGLVLAAEFHELLKKEQKAPVPLLFMSGSVEQKIGIIGVASSNIFYLEKPFKLENFIRKIQSIFIQNKNKKSAAA